MQWIVYRDFVHLGHKKSPFILTTMRINDPSILFKRCFPNDEKKYYIGWESKSIPEDYLAKRFFIRAAPHSYNRQLVFQGQNQIYNVQHFVDISSDLEVTTVLYEQKKEQKLVSFQASAGAMLILVNKRHETIAHIMKSANKDQRIICVSPKRLSNQ